MFVHGNKKQRKTNRNHDELMDGNTEYTKILGFKVTEKENEKRYILATGFLKCMRIQQVHVSSLHINDSLQRIFINLFPMFLNLCGPKLKFFMKMINSYQIIASFGSYKNADRINQSLNNTNLKIVPNRCQHMTSRRYAHNYFMKN